MWIASWLVCIFSQGCVEIELIKQEYFGSQKDCEIFADKKANELSKDLNTNGHKNQIGYRCEESKTVRKANGT